MISKYNYEIAETALNAQLRQRGIKGNYSREDWDTFQGWKKRGKFIAKGSRGFQVDIVFPHLISKQGKKELLGFNFRKTNLFLSSQTL